MASQTSPLPPIHRYITTHAPNGTAVFDSTLPSSTPLIPNSDGIAFALSYTTNTFPPNLSADADITIYTSYLASPPGLVVRGGTVLRHVDIPPNTACKMHRTVSLDYGCVIEGEVELRLDSGEARVMRKGDVAVQRGTMHQWVNRSEQAWARMLFVLQECVPVEIGGRVLGEDLAGMAGVRASD